ncbi:ATP-binding protein [Actinokineospora diospyrosa]|uniref:Anti-sigma regulatory factor (Ser/Thr protein kinase) n=1 Tax=Actinokineospora diospyrosa TaxID=103728 RepID=A0ABT1IEW4_9PSEU|nr:ATP-binding protein [Actinokineospora diospyrosa]MCP2271178.1 Anti-sigma regulatory factor (Ser/Thr protein kinase) [Actinokineospora diospyrosa]
MSSSTLRVEIAAQVGGIAVVRSALRAWLVGQGLFDQRGQDILLAVDEAVTNSVEHAYRGGTPGPVVLTALTTGGGSGSTTVRVSVADRGQWVTPAGEGGGGLAVRGRGLKIIESVADLVRVDRGTTSAPGTTTVVEFAIGAAVGVR